MKTNFENQNGILVSKKKTERGLEIHLVIPYDNKDVFDFRPFGGPDIALKDLGFSSSLSNKLMRKGIKTLRDLVEKEEDLPYITGIGKKTVEYIQFFLKNGRLADEIL